MMIPITSLFQFKTICFSFVGHLPNTLIEWISQNIYKCHCILIFFGHYNCSQTLIPQAIGNHDNHNNTLQTSYLIALYIQQCLFVSIIMLSPLTLLQFFSGSIMTAIGQPFDLCPIIESYCRALIPYLWASNILMIVNRTGRALMLNTEIMVIFITGSICTYLLNYLFIDVLNYSYIWTAIALDLCQILHVLLIICLLIYKGHGYIFKPLPLKDVTRWKDGILTYLQLAIPALIQIVSSWCITELIVLFTGFIRIDTSVAVGATAITTQINSFGKITSNAISTPVAIRVGGYIGAGSVKWQRNQQKLHFCILMLH